MNHREPNQPEREKKEVDAWIEFSKVDEIDQSLRELHSTIHDETTKRAPRCAASGRCCHFESFGHRLYTTGLEVAWTLQQIDRELTATDVIRAQHDGTCPFLENEQCSIHEHRPMGCRVFFCDETAQRWQEDLYERAQVAIQKIHDQHGVPYTYQEWRALLARFTMTPSQIDLQAEQDQNEDPPRGFIQLRIER